MVFSLQLPEITPNPADCCGSPRVVTALTVDVFHLVWIGVCRTVVRAS